MGPLIAALQGLPSRTNADRPGVSLSDTTSGADPEPTPPPPAKKPPTRHSGHRDRLRERAAKGGIDALPDYELLEMLLFRSIPYRDTKPLAKDLLARFGSLEGISAASHEAIDHQIAESLQIVRGKLTRATALDLQLIFDVARRVAREPAAKRPVISSWSALVAYVRVALQHEPREQFRVLYLDRWCAFRKTESLVGIHWRWQGSLAAFH